MKKLLLASPVAILCLFLATGSVFAQCTFDIRVVDMADNPLEGITVTSSSGGSCTSDASGNCPIDFGSSGSYTLSASGCPDQVVTIDCTSAGLYWINYRCDEGIPAPPEEGPEGPGGGELTSACGKSQATDWEIRSSWPDDTCCDISEADPYECTETCPCPSCNKTNYLTPDCAQSFFIHHPLKVDRNDCGYECPPGSGKWFTTVYFDGAVSVSASNTKVPFAGKKKERANADLDTEGHEDEIYYLADYFEGTHEYYRDYPLKVDLPLIDDTAVGHGIYSGFITNYQGVLRKLTPYEYQNQIKRSMVTRAILSNSKAIEYGKIHDYKVKYLSRLCWNSPPLLHLAEMIISWIGDKLGRDLGFWEALDYCLFAQSEVEEELIQQLKSKILDPLNIPNSFENDVEVNLSELIGHEPPSPADFENPEDYAEAWEKWAGPADDRSKWWRLWQAVPMVTREDTLGYIYPHPELRDYNDGKAEFWEGPWQKEIRIPHLARLWETSRLVQQTLLPQAENFYQASDMPLLAGIEKIETFDGKYTTAANQTDSQTITYTLSSTDTAPNGCGAASLSSNNVLGKKTLLAQEESCFHLEASASYSEPNVDVTIYFVSHTGDGHIDLWRDGSRCGLVQTIWNRNVNNPFVVPPEYTCSPVVVNRGQCVTTTWSGTADACPEGVGHASVSCTFCVDTAGKFTSTCGITPPPFPQPPSCNLPPVPFSDLCIKEAITDSHPNDTICTKEMVGEVYGIEEVENPYCGAPHNCGDISDENCSTCKRCYNNNNPIACEQCNFPQDQVETCCKSLGAEAVREIELYTDIPYMTESWDQTTTAKQGFFNIFRPAEIPVYEDMRAKGTVNYGYAGPDGAHAEPGSGDFYYPHLGGIQLSKEWVIKTLTPYVE